MLRPPQPLLSPPPPPAPRRTSWQLPLPLAAPGAADGALAPPPAPPLADSAVHEVWHSLSPAQRAEVRGVLCRILQEVVRDARRG
jgi:hypothetical protein